MYCRSAQKHTMQNEFSVLIGEDAQILAALRLAERVAPTPATVLIVGETGTGKELIARHVHIKSTRAKSEFLAVNCGALAESLIESELFGHTRGAFTGANSRKAGKFEAAHRGTLFLDEVTSMGSGLQSALLRVLQSGEYCPVGATRPLVCDVRVIAAANRELSELVKLGTFRADLYYRLNIVRIMLPPLRERRADLPALVNHFLKVHGSQVNRRDLSLDPSSMRVLSAYDFPGNVRELESIIQRAVLYCDGPVVSVQGLLDAPLNGSDAKAPRSNRVNEPRADNFHKAKAQVVETFERDYIFSALQRCRGVVADAARTSGLSERNFHLKLRKYDQRRAERIAQ